MNADALTVLLRDVQKEILGGQVANALKLIRDAKIVDLNNPYLSALEHLVADQPVPPSTESTSDRVTAVIPQLIERAVADCVRRSAQQPEETVLPDEEQLTMETIKNLYFQRTDQFIEAKEYGRAMEEVQRIFFFDPQNIVAKEYVRKIAQLAALLKKK